MMLESQEQQALMGWAELMSGRYPELVYLFHIPNGGKRSKIEAARLKREGVKAGVSDLCLPAPHGKYHGLYLEMKTKGGRISPEQKDFLAFVKNNGYAAFVAWSWDEAAEMIEKYIKLGDFDGKTEMC